jgi:hypothetical protein
MIIEHSIVGRARYVFCPDCETTGRFAVFSDEAKYFWNKERGNNAMV